MNGFAEGFLLQVIEPLPQRLQALAFQMLLQESHEIGFACGPLCAWQERGTFL